MEQSRQHLSCLRRHGRGRGVLPRGHAAEEGRCRFGEQPGRGLAPAGKARRGGRLVSPRDRAGTELHARAYNNLANVLKEQGRPAEAIACYQRALDFDQDFAEARVGLGSDQHEMGRSEDAIINYSMAILSKPDLAPANSNLGIICEERGDFAQPERLFRAAIRSDPRFAAAHAELAGLLRGRLPDADRQAMQTLLLDQSLNDEQRAMLHFGLVQAFDARGEYVQAAEHSLAANALRLVQWRAAGQHYNREAHTGFINRLIAQFSPEYFARVRDWGNTSPRPVFIVGMPRSGTTLLEQILGGHSQVFAAGELTLGRDGFETAFGHAPPSFNPEPTATEQRLRDEIDREFVQRLAAAHLADLKHRNSTAERVVSKLPENYLYLGYLATILPRARSFIAAATRATWRCRAG